MIATVIMLVVVATSARLFTYFSTNFLSSRERDSIGALIQKDISKMRQLVKDYCRIPNPLTLQACNGTIATQDWNGSYNPDDKINGDCDQSRLAEAMKTANPNQFPNTEILDTSSGPSNVRNVAITRRLSAQGNELSLNYATTSGSSIAVQTSTTLVPPALGWCP